MVREHYVVVLPINHIGVFYIGLCVSGGSHIKCTYMIGREHSHVVLPDHARISLYGITRIFCKGVLCFLEFGCIKLECINFNRRCMM